MKVCTKCGEPKELKQFSRDKTKSSGTRSSCRECCRLKFAAWKKSNPERAKENSKSWYLANSEKEKARMLDWKSTNGERYQVAQERRNEKRRLATEFKHLGGEAYSG